MKKNVFTFAAIGLSLSCLQSASAADFLIKPYLFSIFGQHIGVAWQYAATPNPTPKLSLFQGGTSRPRIDG